ncbi:AraC family transcriptional regulator [Pseudonocardia sediminis]|uniref:AraC family transcriptional regulator n=1 Tax=Pseudonocardia sediminis TaxID=1397368 RepID=A0A4Q7UYQ9_PSEST|nr:helix-turn-helix domain-containing protein [Pseudonocardia sediminis]RZT86264.1 AraC family transcriptional regulator [Pseudonocardia sediminis]
MVLAPGSEPVERSTRRYDEWRETLRHDFVALDVAPDRSRAASFAGTARSTTLAHLQVSEVGSVAQTCRRTPQLAGHDHREYLQVGMLARGTASLEQDGRSTVLHPGDMALYETGRPFCWSFGGDWVLQVFTWPRDTLDLAASESAAATARRLDGRSGLGAIVGGVLRDLVTSPPPLSAPGAVRLADEVGGLVVTLAGERTAGAPVAASERSRAELREQIELHIAARLDDPDLGPASIAAALFISPRQLHRLYAETGESVTRRIRRSRLEHARRDLGDRRLADASITHVARRYGFTDLAAFSRAFRTAYGVSPSEYRCAGRALP